MVEKIKMPLSNTNNSVLFKDDDVEEYFEESQSKVNISESINCKAFLTPGDHTTKISIKGAGGLIVLYDKNTEAPEELVAVNRAIWE